MLLIYFCKYVSQVAIIINIFQVELFFNKFIRIMSISISVTFSSRNSSTRSRRSAVLISSNTFIKYLNWILVLNTLLQDNGFFRLLQSLQHINFYPCTIIALFGQGLEKHERNILMQEFKISGQLSIGCM